MYLRFGVIISALQEKKCQQNKSWRFQEKKPSTRLYLTVLKWSVACPVACSSYTVCASAQASIFMVFWPVSPKKIAKLLKKSERWPNKWSKVKTLEDKPRSEWPFFHKLCEKYYRKSCKYMRNNSTKQKGKKISTSHYRSKFRAQRYGDKLPKKVWKALKRKKQCTLHAGMVSEGFANFTTKRIGQQTHVIWTP